MLAPYALAIGLFSLANILVGYHLSRGETRYAWIVAAGVLVQIAVLATFPRACAVSSGRTSLSASACSRCTKSPSGRASRRCGPASAPPRRCDGSEAVLPEAALVLAGTTAFVCVLFAPVVIHLGSTIVGTLGADATGSVAWFWQARHESGFHLLGLTHHTLTGAPFGWNETNALNLQVFLPYYPTYLLAHVVGDIAAYNLTLLAGYVLSGATMYSLVRYLGCARLVAAWAALVASCFPGTSRERSTSRSCTSRCSPCSSLRSSRRRADRRGCASGSSVRRTSPAG